MLKIFITDYAFYVRRKYKNLVLVTYLMNLKSSNVETHQMPMYLYK